MKKILYIIDKPNLYGSELHLLDLVQYYKSEYSIRVVAFDEGPLIDRFNQLGVKVDVIHFSWIPSLYALMQLIKVIKEFSPSIIHSHQPKSTFWGNIIGCFLHKNRIATIHSSVSDTSKLRNNWTTKFIVLIFHYFVQFVSELLANKVIFVSNSSQKKSFFKYKSVVVYNWINNMPDKKINKALSTAKVRLLTLGSISLAKGFDLLLDFCSKLDSKLYKISIVGDGEAIFVDGIKKQFLALELESEFLGFKNDTSPNLMNADIYVSLSRSETFGLAFAQAASFGLPIFARNLDVLHEILPNGNYLNNDNQDLVSGLNDLIKNPHLFEQISTTNYEWAKLKFSFLENIQKLTAEYNYITSS